MRKSILSIAILAFTAFALAMTSLSAQATLLSCTNQYETSNGTTSFPGTNVGTIGTGCLQIGGNGGINGGPSLVNTSDNPSNYEFFFAGGTMTIDEALGNNGIGYNIDVELDSLASQSSTTPSAILSSIEIPYSSGPTFIESTLWNGNLGAGWYTVSTYLGPCGNSSACDSNNAGVTDPDYQINFEASAVPEPSSIALFGTGLLGLAGMLRRKLRR